MEEVFEQIQNFFTKNSQYGYLFAGIVLLTVAIGNFKNWDWFVSPSGYRQTYWYNFFGRNFFRKFMGFVFLIGSIACFINFWLLN